MVTYNSVYDNGLYNQIHYGWKGGSKTANKKYYGVCPIGISIRRQIGHKFIYRIRPGNGYFFSEIGVKYQDKYQYFVPPSINNPEGQHARDVFKNAVTAWQALPEAEKNIWRAKERYISGVSGYNLFIKDYMQKNL